MPENPTGNIFEDVKRVIRSAAFGSEAAAKMESIVDMYAQDKEGDKNLLTALAIIGLFPEDKIESAINVYSASSTVGELTENIAKEYLTSVQEQRLQELVDVTGTLSMDAKEKIFKNLSKTLPKMLEYKYTVENTYVKYKKELEIQDKRLSGD
jgi:regulator of sigma D